MMKNVIKNVFKDIYTRHITRNGAQELLDRLEGSDFFEAPASTRHHLARPGGLVEHSINVYRRLRALYADEYGESVAQAHEETIAIVGLLHDVCKANYYDVEMRNRKNEQGQWEQYPFYIVKDQYPLGHGEKSLYLISRFMHLSTEEAMAIRWHMGGFDESVRGGSYAMSDAFQQYPLALLTHLADMQATYINEVEG